MSLLGGRLLDVVAFSSSSSIFCQVCRGRSAEGQGDGTGERLVRCPSRQNVRARQRKGKRFVYASPPRRRRGARRGSAGTQREPSENRTINRTILFVTKLPHASPPRPHHTQQVTPLRSHADVPPPLALGTWSRGARNYIPSVILPLASGCVAKGSSRMELNQRTEAAFTSHRRQLMLKFSASESPFPNGSRKDLESSRKPR